MKQYNFLLVMIILTNICGTIAALVNISQSQQIMELQRQISAMEVVRE